MATKSTYNIHKANASTTLNEIYPSQSFHLDETMIVGKVISSSLISGGPYRKRALMQFTSFVTQSGYDKAYLQVYEALAKDQQTAGMIELGFQSSSTATGNIFEQGRGRRDSRPAVKEGSTFKFQSVDNDVEWTEQTASVKENFMYSSSADIDTDVSTLLAQINAVDARFRFVHLNYASSLEDDSTKRGEIEYYSANTHTIYQPTLVVASESVAVCASGKEDGDFSLDNEYLLYHKNLKPTYQPNTNITFKFGARTLYQKATYGTSSATLGNNYIPSESTYNFKDVKANELVLPNSMQAVLGIESNKDGHIIENVPSNLFYPYRKYQLVINVVSGSTTDTFVLPETFQVEA